MLQPEHAFAAVLISQILGLTALSIRFKVSRRRLMRGLLGGFSFGLLLGLAFDFVIGKTAAVFTYYASTTIGFLVLNGILSYGLSFASITILPRRKSQRARYPKAGLTLLVIAAMLAVAVISLSRESLLLHLFALGGTILLLGEGVALLIAPIGPIADLMLGRSSDFVRLWLVSIGLGAFYEIANALWPVWHWIPAETLGATEWWLLLVGFGYFVLFHSMWILSSFLEKETSTGL